MAIGKKLGSIHMFQLSFIHCLKKIERFYTENIKNTMHHKCIENVNRKGYCYQEHSNLQFSANW